MGLCNNCRSKGKPEKPEQTEKMFLEPISTCDACHQRYWTATGELENGGPS